MRSRVPDAAEAEDVTSEVFARAWRDWERYDVGRGSVRAWLLGIANHVVVDSWRSRAVQTAPLEASHAADAAEREFEATGETLARLRDGISTLSDREREALALRFSAGLTSKEIGELLGLSEGATKMLVHRAIGKLRAVMADEG